MAGKYYVACSNESDHLWELLSSTTMWFIWKAQCIKVFEGREVPPIELLVAIWNDMVSTLRGQYDMIKGVLEVEVLARRGFEEKWSGSLLNAVETSLCSIKALSAFFRHKLPKTSFFSRSYLLY